jgi:hypothetical protein
LHDECAEALADGRADTAVLGGVPEEAAAGPGEPVDEARCGADLASAATAQAPPRGAALAMLSKSALARLRMSIFSWNSAFTVLISSLTDCSSSLELCSSSFEAINSSLVACSSSLEVSSSSIVACRLSRVAASSCSSTSSRSEVSEPMSTGKGRSPQPIAARQWSSGFLPSKHQGVQLRSQGDPVLYLNNPPGISRAIGAEFVRRGLMRQKHLCFTLLLPV